MGLPPPGATRGLGVLLASYCHPAVYASRARLSMLWRSASAKESMNAPGTFCGLLPHTDPQIVPDLRGHRNRLLSAGGGAEDTLPKGRGPEETWLEASEWPISESCELPCQDRSSSRAQAPQVPSLGAAGYEYTCPAASKWLQSSYTEFSEVESINTNFVHIIPKQRLHSLTTHLIHFAQGT